MHSAPEDIQGYPDDVETLRALLLTTIAERDAALSERDALQQQNDRLYDLLRKLRRMQFGAKPSGCRKSNSSSVWKRSSRRSRKVTPRRRSVIPACAVTVPPSAALAEASCRATCRRSR
jgi:hypothetical protein